MKTALADELFRQELISQSEWENMKVEKPFSVHWDLRSLLYVGILLLSTSIGILVYKNIETIGHDVLLIIISVLTVACFIYCFKKANGYKHTKINAATIWQDYILLTGCLLLLTLFGYAQFQYNIFGSRWGLVLFIPMILLFLAAYYFDHLGVLSLAITNLAAWAGVAITPSAILQQNDFNEERIMFTGLALGAFLVGLSILSKWKNIKTHFSFTYQNFGIHLFFISLLAILFTYEGIYLLILLALALMAFVFYKMAIREGSSYFLVVTLLYSYIGVSYAAVRLLSIDSDGGIYGMLLYFIFSGVGLITVFKKLQKKIKTQ